MMQRNKIASSILLGLLGLNTTAKAAELVGEAPVSAKVVVSASSAPERETNEDRRREALAVRRHAVGINPLMLVFNTASISYQAALTNRWAVAVYPWYTWSGLFNTGVSLWGVSLGMPYHTSGRMFYGFSLEPTLSGIWVRTTSGNGSLFSLGGRLAYAFDVGSNWQLTSGIGVEYGFAGTAAVRNHWLPQAKLGLSYAF